MKSVKAQATGQDMIKIPEKILAGIQAQAKEVTSSAGFSLAWPGILRKLDRVNYPATSLRSDHGVFSALLINPGYAD